jgi:hypothetical protein
MKNLSEMTVAALRAMAKSQGLKGYSKCRKADLVALLTPKMEVKKEIAKTVTQYARQEYEARCASLSMSPMSDADLAKSYGLRYGDFDFDEDDMTSIYDATARASVQISRLHLSTHKMRVTAIVKEEKAQKEAQAEMAAKKRRPLTQAEVTRRAHYNREIDGTGETVGSAYGVQEI